MSDLVGVAETESAPGRGSARAAPSLPLHLGLGWVIAGLLNVLYELLPKEDGGVGGPGVALGHVVDLGRHLGFGLFSIGCAWLLALWLPASSLLGWLGFAAGSLLFGALCLPTDLDGLAERLAELFGLGADLSSALLVLAVSGAVPLLAWLTRHRPWRRRGLGIGVQAASGLLALAAFALNVSISPGNNPSAHLYLSWLTAVLAAGALPRLEFSIAVEPRRRLAELLLVGALAGGSLWALFGRHSNSVRIRLARRSSSLQLLAVLHGDAGRDKAQAIVAARAGPFFAPRSVASPVPPSHSRPAVERPIVVLFSIDSLRADLLGRPEGRRSMPHLSALAQTGASFEKARAPGSMTKYTLGAISSGRYFSQQYWTGPNNKWPTHDTSVHFASVLSAAGVYTAAFPAVDWLENSMGILRGFERNQLAGERLPGKPRWIDGKALTTQLISSLESNAGRPAFYWVHYLDTHEPYAQGGGSAYERYLRALSTVDGYLGQLQEAIAHRGLAERALLLVISDHGEAFGDHGTRFHGTNLYDELIRVPLIAAGAGVEAHGIDTPVSLIDLGPTILDWFGVDTPASFMGQSLLPLLLGEKRQFARPVVSETGLKQTMLFDDGYKVIRDLRRDTLELYDLRNDPEELHNLSDQIDAEHDEHVLLLESFFQVHTYRENGYRVPYVK